MERVVEPVAAASVTKSSATAVCSTHPDRRASITCPICGSYACGDCTVDTLWGDVMCEGCLAHGRAQYPLPWEQSLSPISFVQTAYLLFAEAPHAFGHFPAGSVRRALGFALQVGLVLGLLDGLTDWLFAARHWASDGPGAAATLGGAVLGASAAVLGSALVVAAVFHGAATLLGGHAGFTVALRAACYVSVIHFVEVANILVDALLMGSAPVTALMRMAAAFFLVWDLSLVAERRYRMPRGRAIGAALTPALLGLLILAALLVLAYRGA